MRVQKLVQNEVYRTLILGTYLIFSMKLQQHKDLNFFFFWGGGGGFVRDFFGLNSNLISGEINFLVLN